MPSAERPMMAAPSVSGWSRSIAAADPTTSARGRTPPLSVCTCFIRAANIAARKATTASLSISMGWKVMGPSASQRDAPLSSRPMCGTKVSAVRMSAKPKKYGVKRAHLR